jgi:hypothetical protein
MNAKQFVSAHLYVQHAALGMRPDQISGAMFLAQWEKG